MRSIVLQKLLNAGMMYNYDSVLRKAVVPPFSMEAIGFVCIFLNADLVTGRWEQQLEEQNLLSVSAFG